MKLGNEDITLKVGSLDVEAVYLGDTLIYTETTPFEGKWLATYDGGITSSADCDSTSAITKNEIELSNLVSLEIGDCVTSIGNASFSSCTSITSIVIPNSVTSIGMTAFYRCFSISSLEIPSGVTSIGAYAFLNCSGLASITVNAVIPPSLGNYAFDYTNDCPIYVPAESVAAYQSSWSAYSSRIQAIP